MKNKFLAIVAASASVLVSALVSAPAHAQIVPGPNQNISVDVTVPEILYLRTITSATLALTPADFTGVALSQVGTTDAYIGSNQSAGSTLDQSSPFTVGSAITKPINTAYAVWSNSPRTGATGGINVSVSIPGTFANAAGTLPVAVTAGTNVSNQAAPGLTIPYVGNISLDITPSSTTSAGTYTGLVNVQVDAP
ncbi:hypothetical protein NIES4072_03590 [Nostoc commune NIES-4072]|uniref:WxL domain-containing protein n=1 Tax=Nostoc commune NIES-4072 TaxID=2005467 RepID=A0A2R5FKE2_NOSCO|nr:hypothetical protein [Nostoc commune]BBD65962.1 hypothetical protein NIES4070_23230 [Nostoc commune HK-02]GBG16713.1 hypothetical protein NIES4072_03590 [Nostoc commune NIES-4072]